MAAMLNPRDEQINIPIEPSDIARTNLNRHPRHRVAQMRAR
jgi:hypothetical protein